MLRASSSLSSPTLMSVSTPRSWKIRTAAAESLSEISTLGAMARAPGSGGNRSAAGGRSGGLGHRGLALREGPNEPRRERLDVGTFHGRTAPDAQSRRRVAMGGDVVGDALLLQLGSQAFGERRLPVGGKRGDRRSEYLEADRGVGARARIFREEIPPRGARGPPGDDRGIGIGSRDQLRKTADRLRPLQAVEVILDAEQRGRVDGLAFEDRLVELAGLGQAENFRQRPRRRMAFEPLDRARRKDQHAVGGLPAH